MKGAIAPVTAILCFTVVCMVSVSLTGCGDQTKARLAALEKGSAEQNARLNDLEWKTSTTRFSATLSTGNDSYSRLDTDVGHFFVYLKEAASYTDGYMLVIAIGNPNNMTVHGGQLELVWGDGPDKKRVFAFTHKLEPGLWNEVDVFIAPASDEDVKSIAMNMTVSNISLLGKRE